MRGGRSRWQAVATVAHAQPSRMTARRRAREAPGTPRPVSTEATTCASAPERSIVC
jgi:hypothetical protein